MRIEQTYDFFDPSAPAGQQQRRREISYDPVTGNRYERIYWWCTCGGGSWKEVEGSYKQLS